MGQEARVSVTGSPDAKVRAQGGGCFLLEGPGEKPLLCLVQRSEALHPWLVALCHPDPGLNPRESFPPTLTFLRLP